MTQNPQEVAFALITYYPKWYRGTLRSISHTDKIRGDLAIKFIQKVVRNRYQLVVVDGNSSRSFKKTIAGLQISNIIKRRGYKRSPSKRQAFIAASHLPNIKVIVATEAEKVSLLDSIDKIIKPILTSSTDIVIPKRNDALFKSSYPDYMYKSEIEGNKMYNEQLKLDNLLPKNAEELDLFFGPRVFRNEKRILSFFLKKFTFSISPGTFPKGFFDVEELSNASFYPIVLALQKKASIEGVEIPFSYPKLQKENESIGAREQFIEKRRTQRLELLVELMYFLNYLASGKS